jgi:hypothetical protein
MADTATAWRQRLTPERLEVLGAAFVALFVSRNLWLPGRYLSAFDTVAYSAPNLEVTTDAWRSGDLPLWNDTIFGGIVHLGNPQAGALYPPKLIALFVDTNLAMGLIVAGHLVLMAVGTVFLMRRLGCRPPAGFAAALVMTANGVVLHRAVQFEQGIVLAWFPVLLLGITSIMGSERPGRPWRSMAATALVTAMVLMAGHPQITYQAVVVAGVWTAAMLARHRSLPRLGDLAVSAGVGALIAMPHLAAALAGTGDAATSFGRDPETLLQPARSTQYHNLLRVLWGTVRDVNESIFAGGGETIGHVGVAVTIIAAVGIGVLWSRQEKAIAVALSAMAALGIIWALGPLTFVFDVAYEIVPGFDLARASARWLDIMAVAAAIAVGFAIDALMRRDVQPSVVLPAAIIGGVAVLVAATTLQLPDSTTVAVWVVIALALLALLVTADRWRPELLTAAVVLVAVVELAGLSQGASIYEASSDVAFDDLSTAPGDALADEEGLVVAFTDDDLGNPPYFVPGFRPNTNTLADVRSLDGYDGGVQVTERWIDLLERLSENADPELPLRNALPIPFETEIAADLAVRWVLLDNARDPAELLPGWEETRYATEQFSVWENPDWRGPAVARADGETRSLSVERPRPEEVEVDVGGEADETELVVLDQQYAPGWTARADGRDVDTVEADDFFLAARVPPGTETVTFRYEPWWLMPSLLVSLLGIGLVIAGFVLGHRSRSDGDPEDAEEAGAGVTR